MRHVYIRGIMGLIWLAAAIVSVSSNSQMAVLYIILGGVFLYSALRNCAFYPVCYFSGAERFCHIIVTANCQASQFIQFIIF